MMSSMNVSLVSQEYGANVVEIVKASRLKAQNLVDAAVKEASYKPENQQYFELITSCVASVLMIQRSAEQPYPPADVAQIIDVAVESLRPFCSQNLPIYREVQKCMGRIKTQIEMLNS